MSTSSFDIMKLDLTPSREKRLKSLVEEYPELSSNRKFFDDGHEMYTSYMGRGGYKICGRDTDGLRIEALSYYYLLNGGDPKALFGGHYKWMSAPADLYILLEEPSKSSVEDWMRLACPFLLTPGNSAYDNVVAIDSFRHFRKYTHPNRKAVYIVEGAAGVSQISAEDYNEWTHYILRTQRTWLDITVNSCRMMERYK